MELLLICLVFFILLFIILFIIQSIKIRKLSEKPKNNICFYVARDENSLLYLYLGKPKRADFYFMPCKDGYCFVDIRYLQKFGLNPDDFKDLKWEDEPVEVFLNLEN